MDYRVLDEFFSNDLKIKRMLLLSSYDSKESGIDYSDRINNVLNDIEFYFNNICDKLNLLKAKEFLKNKISFFRSQLGNIGCDLSKLTYFYEKYFCGMSNDFIKDVNKVCVGYLGLSEDSLCFLLNGSSSINEILHVFHQYVINNEEILESIPVIQEKKYNNGFPIYLRGKNNEQASNIYDSLLLDSYNGYTDIISLDSKIIMMVRDRGHALTVEIEKENDKYYVQYFIPKVCNVDMVNSLPGVRKVNSFKDFTDGMFEVSEEDLANKVCSFIESIPTDFDIPFLNDSRFKK
jgi:hypothetical protein